METAQKYFSRLLTGATVPMSSVSGASATAGHLKGSKERNKRQSKYTDASTTDTEAVLTVDESAVSLDEGGNFNRRVNFKEDVKPSTTAARKALLAQKLGVPSSGSESEKSLTDIRKVPRQSKSRETDASSVHAFKPPPPPGPPPKGEESDEDDGGVKKPWSSGGLTFKPPPPSVPYPGNTGVSEYTASTSEGTSETGCEAKEKEQSRPSTSSGVSRAGTGVSVASTGCISTKSTSSSLNLVTIEKSKEKIQSAVGGDFTYVDGPDPDATDPLIEPEGVRSLLVRPVPNPLSKREFTLKFDEAYAAKQRDKLFPTRRKNVLDYLKNLDGEKEQDGPGVYNFCEVLGLLGDIDACNKVMLAVKLMKKKGYCDADVVTVLACTLKCLEHVFATSTGNAMDTKERGMVALLQCFLCHCWLQDESIPLKRWYREVFSDYCSYKCLVSVVTRLWSLRDYRLHMRLEEVKEMKALLLRSPESVGSSGVALSISVFGL